MNLSAEKLIHCLLNILQRSIINLEAGRLKKVAYICSIKLSPWKENGIQNDFLNNTFFNLDFILDEIAIN